MKEANSIKILWNHLTGLGRGKVLTQVTLKKVEPVKLKAKKKKKEVH